MRGRQRIYLNIETPCGERANVRNGGDEKAEMYDVLGSIAAPAVEGSQLLYFDGAKNNVGLFLFRESRFMDRVIAPVCVLMAPTLTV
jgi:hypothetical protein